MNKKFLRCLAIMVVWCIVVTTHCALWHGMSSGAIGKTGLFASVLNFIMENVAIYFAAKKWAVKEDEDR